MAINYFATRIFVVAQPLTLRPRNGEEPGEAEDVKCPPSRVGIMGGIHHP